MTDPTTTPPAKPKPSGLLSRIPAAKPRGGVEQWLFTSVRDEVAELLRGSPFDVDSYLQNAYREIEKSNQLRMAAEQAGGTVLGGIMLGATLQLPIGGPLGQFYLTPRGEGRGQDRRTVCVPMIGYRGFFELGYRSGRVASYDYKVVREGDKFEEGSNSERGNWYDWERAEGFDGDEGENGVDVRPLTGVVAIVRLLNGNVQYRHMSRATIDRRKPKNTTNTPWEGPHAEGMYIKTPHRELAKFQQLSIATARAVEADEAISIWNRATESVETIHEGEAVPIEAEVIHDDGGTPASEREVVVVAEEPAPSAPEGQPQPAEAAAGRTAPPESTANIDALDLPAHVRGLGREMTTAEFDRYSAAGGD